MYTLKVLKCGPAEGIRSFRPIVWKVKKYYKTSRKKGISYFK